MISSEGCFECEFVAGVTDPVERQWKLSSALSNEQGALPDPLGVKAAAAAAFGDMPSLAGCAFVVVGVKFGVKAGDSTLRDFFGLQSTQLMLRWMGWKDSHVESVS